jgi:hypothetical protein
LDWVRFLAKLKKIKNKKTMNKNKNKGKKENEKRFGVSLKLLICCQFNPSTSKLIISIWSISN